MLLAKVFWKLLKTVVKQVVDDADIQVDKEKAIDDELSEKESDEIV